MGGRLQRALQLSARDWATLAYAWVAMIVADVALRAAPLDRVEHRFHASPRAQAGERDATGTEAELQRVHRLVAIAARYHVVRARCLHRSLVLVRLLSRQGFAVRLRVGVRRAGEELAAHAWVEHDGHPVGEEAAGFAPLEARSAVR